MKINLIIVMYISLVHCYPEPPGYSYPKLSTDFKPPSASSDYGYYGDASYDKKGGGGGQAEKHVHIHKIFLKVAPPPQPTAEKIIIKQPASILPQMKHLKILFKTATGSSSSSFKKQHQPQRTVYEIIKKPVSQ